ncbi:MAG: hypothetical protein R3244_11645 [Thermoanaerobaculia bacterium]|nr:hypothetical protein [Thermoanaerobaculia bacterium]
MITAFTAPNPPFGAVFTYYLRDDRKTDLEERRAREEEIAAEGGDTPYPGFEVMKEEALEKDPVVLLTVEDSAGAVVRRLTGPAKAGFHRVAWDLRYPSTMVDTGGWRSRGDSGVLAAPGTYRVRMATRVDGVVTELGEQSFEVVPLWDGGTLPGDEPSAVGAFLREVAETMRLVSAAGAVIDETSERLEAIEAALARSTTDEYDDEVAEMQRRLYAMRDRLSGDQQRAKMGENQDHTIEKYLQVASFGTAYSTYGATPTHVESLETANELLAALRRDLAQLVDVDLPALEERLEEAGVVWTPGRQVP